MDLCLAMFLRSFNVYFVFNSVRFMCICRKTCYLAFSGQGLAFFGQGLADGSAFDSFDIYFFFNLVRSMLYHFYCSTICKTCDSGSSILVFRSKVIPKQSLLCHSKMVQVKSNNRTVLRGYNCVYLVGYTFTYVLVFIFNSIAMIWCILAGYFEISLKQNPF